jgi:hypothetical protein
MVFTISLDAEPKQGTAGTQFTFKGKVNFLLLLPAPLIRVHLFIEGPEKRAPVGFTDPLGNYAITQRLTQPGTYYITATAHPILPPYIQLARSNITTVRVVS